MIKSGLLAAALAAAAMFATPAMARTGAVISAHLAADADPGHVVHGSLGVRTPRVGAHAAPAPAGGTCDVGDNERVC